MRLAQVSSTARSARVIPQSGGRAARALLGRRRQMGTSCARINYFYPFCDWRPRKADCEREQLDAALARVLASAGDCQPAELSCPAFYLLGRERLLFVFTIWRQQAAPLKSASLYYVTEEHDLDQDKSPRKSAGFLSGAR